MSSDCWDVRRLLLVDVLSILLRVEVSAFIGDVPASNLDDDRRLSFAMLICEVELKLLLISEAMLDASMGVPGMFSFVILGPNILL